MITHFPKMRRYIKLSAFLAPTLSFIAFVLYASESEGLALLVGLIAFVVFYAFPNMKDSQVSPTTEKWSLTDLFNFIPSILIMCWLISLENFRLLLDQIYSSTSLWDWRLILAVLIWHMRWVYISYKKASNISDEDIIDIFDSRSTQ